MTPQYAGASGAASPPVPRAQRPDLRTYLTRASDRRVRQRVRAIMTRTQARRDAPASGAGAERPAGPGEGA